MASNGDKQALAQFFSFGDFMDGEAAEGYYPQAWELFHVVGDKNFSNFVRDLPVTDQLRVRGTLIGGAHDEEFANTADLDYLERYFPRLICSAIFPKRRRSSLEVRSLIGLRRMDATAFVRHLQTRLT